MLYKRSFQKLNLPDCCLDYCVVLLLPECRIYRRYISRDGYRVISQTSLFCNYTLLYVIATMAPSLWERTTPIKSLHPLRTAHQWFLHAPLPAYKTRLSKMFTITFGISVTRDSNLFYISTHNCAVIQILNGVIRPLVWMKKGLEKYIRRLV